MYVHLQRDTQRSAAPKTLHTTIKESDALTVAQTTVYVQYYINIGLDLFWGSPPSLDNFGKT